MLAEKNTSREILSKELSDIKRSDLGKELARLQRELNKTKKSMLVIVDGWESSGKGTLLKDLTRELDPKYYEVSVFEESSEEEDSHPYLYRFFMNAPYEGQISFFDRSFYYDLWHNLDMTDDKLSHIIDDIDFVEEALVKNDTLVIKFFLHQTKEEMSERIEKLEEDDYRHILLDGSDYNQLNNYKDYYKHFNRILSDTSHEEAPWDILYVDGKKNTSRKALQICIDRLEVFLAKETIRESPKLPEIKASMLDQVDLTASISEEDYDNQLKDLQQEAGDLMFEAYAKGKPVVVAYEGTDAAGKGGNIERLTRYMDPRGYDVATVSGPTKHELAHHYLWRFYRDFPTNGRLTIFDRSWYGRVLVERVEGITPEYRWKEAYDEINEMEHNLTHQGWLVLKYLLIIDKPEQLDRFEDRAEDPDKRHKLTEEDFRNHEKFDVYKEAMDDMVNYTSTEEVPWVIISGMDKKLARITVLKDFIERIKVFLDD